MITFYQVMVNVTRWDRMMSVPKCLPTKIRLHAYYVVRYFQERRKRALKSMYEHHQPTVLRACLTALLYCNSGTRQSRLCLGPFLTNTTNVRNPDKQTWHFHEWWYLTGFRTFNHFDIFHKNWCQDSGQKTCLKKKHYRSEFQNDNFAFVRNDP